MSEWSRVKWSEARQVLETIDQIAVAEGLRFERRVFHSMFALDDQKEGMAAFSEKRPANFRNR